jgi:hypothetical protein
MKALSTVTRTIRKLLVPALMAFATVAGLTFGPLTQSAAAVTCRERTYYAFTSSNTYLLEGFPTGDGGPYRAATTSNYVMVHTVPNPPTSYCSYINVKAIENGWGSGGGCWSFRVEVYGTPNTATAESGYCASVASGAVVGIASVADGKQYSIYFNDSNVLKFNIRD